MTDASPQLERPAIRQPLSSRTKYTPETDLPQGLASAKWAKALWAKKHPDGPYCVVYQLFPLDLLVAGWVSWAGSMCIPKLVDCAVDPEAWEEDVAHEDLGWRVFNRGPSPQVIEEAARVARRYAENGRKGGRPKSEKPAADTGNKAKPKKAPARWKPSSKPR
jgi:hypothetical protein